MSIRGWWRAEHLKRRVLSCLTIYVLLACRGRKSSIVSLAREPSSPPVIVHSVAISTGHIWEPPSGGEKRGAVRSRFFFTSERAMCLADVPCALLIYDFFVAVAPGRQG